MFSMITCLPKASVCLTSITLRVWAWFNHSRLKRIDLPSKRLLWINCIIINLVTGNALRSLLRNIISVSTEYDCMIRKHWSKLKTLSYCSHYIYVPGDCFISHGIYLIVLYFMSYILMVFCNSQTDLMTITINC